MQPAPAELPFQTTRPPLPLYCHQEFLDKLAARHNEPTGKRASLLLQRMAVDISRLHYKSTHGVNRGWRRSRLGGGSGSHFYAWWAPAGSPPLKEANLSAESEAIFLRDIRHHDDHSKLDAGDFAADYLPLSVPDLRGSAYAPEPWTSTQAKFARSRSVARILKGHPGSGKTTALLHAADASQAERVLYLTFSTDLAILARNYFDRFCSNARSFTVLTFPAFLGQLLGGHERPTTDPVEARAQFRRDLYNYQRSLGGWSRDIDALYDEMHAHMVGAALPAESGRFAKAERVRLPDTAYRSQRHRYLGPAVDGVLEAAKRLERNGEAPLVDRYFPELATAWRAAHALHADLRKVEPAFLQFGCIAVDEVQDLTPLEAFVVMELARKTQSSRVSLLLAGDEAQTVRPTDFEWAWMNDMLHSTLTAPQEFKLNTNLRSPRRIAEIVNRVWDLYDYLSKQDRPSGNSYAEIDDDGPEQVLYAAIRKNELPDLLRTLSTHEGLAVIAFDKKKVPADLLPYVLSPAEAKGLDFHSVCVLDGGQLLEQIVDQRIAAPSEALRQRLAIDQLRVALSRPTERLLWVDTEPTAVASQEAGRLLRPELELYLHPTTAEGLRASLDEEELDLEERLQRCQKDARQLVSVKPDLAWARAQQAVSLVKPLTRGERAQLQDRMTYFPAWREATFTLSEICFQLAFRKKKLAPELGKIDLYQQASRAADDSGKHKLGSAIREIGIAEQSWNSEERLNRVAAAIQKIVDARDELPAWFLVEITPRAPHWVDELELHLAAGDNSLLAQTILPPFFDVMQFPDAAARKERLVQRSVQLLIKNKRFAQALVILERQPDANQKLMAECYEETGQYEKGAAIWIALGDRTRALKCYRSIPDFEASLKLVRELDEHPARPSLEWLAELGTVLAKRPDNFNRAMTQPEKKLLEDLLERGLGVQRKKPAATKKVAAPAKKKAPAKTVRPKAPPF